MLHDSFECKVSRSELVSVVWASVSLINHTALSAECDIEPLDAKCVILETFFPANNFILLQKKLNLRQQKRATHTHTQPFYGSVDSVWDNPGKPLRAMQEQNNLI